MLHYSSSSPLSDLTVSIPTKQLAARCEALPGASTATSTLGRTPPRLRHPSHPRGTYGAPSSSLAEPSACEPTPDPSRRGDQLLSSQNPSNSHTRASINYPCRACVQRHSYHTFPPSEVYFFRNHTTVGIPPTSSQYCTSTRRPANLEISVLPSPCSSITISSLPQSCRRSPFSSLRTQGRAQQPLNEYAITIITLHPVDARWIFNT